jgi:hypothetical protein
MRSPPPEGSLEKLITDRQDELRGRPRDWLDDFKDWRQGIDWRDVLFNVSLLMSFIWMAAVMVSLWAER